MLDPTRKEMIEFLETQTCGEDMEFEIEEAIYWFSSHWHGGQLSNLYSALSTSPYNPSPFGDEPEDNIFIEALENEYATNQQEATQ